MFWNVTTIPLPSHPKHFIMTKTILGLSQQVYNAFKAADGNPALFKQQLPDILAQRSVEMKPGASAALITDLCALQDSERHLSIQLLEVSKHFKYVN